MTDYRAYLDRQGVPRGPWVVRDRDRSAEGDETPQAAQPEARARASEGGIAQVIRMPGNYSGEGMRREKGGSGNG